MKKFFAVIAILLVGVAFMVVIVCTIYALGTRDLYLFILALIVGWTCGLGIVFGSVEAVDLIDKHERLKR